jgi:hypothetical protein
MARAYAPKIIREELQSRGNTLDITDLADFTTLGNAGIAIIAAYIFA